MLKKEHLYFSLFLFILGFLGILTLLLMPFNYGLLPEEALVLITKQFSEFQLRMMTTINPIILLIVSLLIGLFVYRNDSSHSYIQALFFKNEPKVSVKETLTTGIVFGFLIALMMVVIYYFMKDNENIQLLESTSPDLPIITKIFYGGITEEIIVRWGWLSFIYFILFKITKSKKYSIILAIVISSFLFGLGHIGNVFLIDNINILFVVTYIILFNFLIGLPLGYLFIKKI